MKSILRSPEISPITLEEFYKKIENDEFEQRIKLLITGKENKNQVFEILTVLGKGRAGFVFLTLKDGKLAALRMSYEKESLTGKFDSIIEAEWRTYKESFLDILYPAAPVQHLYTGVLRKRKTISFDNTVYASLWEKADTTLISKLNESFEKKFHWFRQFLAGLNFIHARNRVHCDIKLDNLFLVGGRLKIGDFEFYSKIEDFRQSDIFLCGTPGHIAPEMFYRKELLTRKIDIFSAGIAFTQLFMGEEYRPIEPTPEENRQLADVLEKCKEVDSPALAHTDEIKESLGYLFFYRRVLKDKIEKTAPGGFERFLYEEILLEMMALDPAQRPDVKEIIAKLEKKAPPDKSFVGVQAPLRGGGKTNLLRFLVGFLAVLAAAASLYFFVFNKGAPTGSPGSSISPQSLQRDANKTKVIKPPVKSVEPSETAKPGISPEEKEKIKEQTKYETYLDIARGLVKNREYEKALEMIARAKEIKEDDELRELERAIERLIENDVQDGYKKFYDDAYRAYERGDYEEALRNIEIARGIKDTPQSVSLELQIKRKIEEREEEYERGLALVEERINNEEYANAKELIDALKKIKADDRLLKLEKEAHQKLAQAAQQRQEEESEYMECLQKAQEYMDNGDYEKAEEEIKKAGNMKNTELLKRLEEKLEDLQEQTQQEYEKYSKWARVYFDNGQLEKAADYLELAKKIRYSQELWVLEREIREKAREREQEGAARKADDEAYSNAIRRGEVWDLDKYIREYPRGRHAAEAEEKLNTMLERLIPVVKEPRVIKKVEPVYHRRSGRKAVTGVVRLEVVIDKYGNVQEVKVMEGHRTLRYAAIKAVKQWKYEPVFIGGQARSVWFRVNVVFESNS